MPAYKPYLKLRSRRKSRINEPLDGEFFFAENVADSPCDAAFYLVPHKSEPMFKVGWSVAADRRLDTINEIWGKQLDIYSALVIATSREAAMHAERTMKLILNHQGWKIDGLPPLEGWSEFFSVGGLLHAYDACMDRLLPTMRDMEQRTHVVEARGADETAKQMFQRIVATNAGKSVSPDSLLARMMVSGLRRVDIPKIINGLDWDAFPLSIINALSDGYRFKSGHYATHADYLWKSFGGELLKQPVNFIKIASRYGIPQESEMLGLLDFVMARNVVLKEQSSEWLSDVLGTLPAKAIVKLVVDHNIELRNFTFTQRAKLVEKILSHQDKDALVASVLHLLDDIDQLVAETHDRWALNRGFNQVNMILLNPSHVPQGHVPKNFPAVLARIYYDCFDGLHGDSIIRKSPWPGHEQIYFKLFNSALDCLKGSVDKKINLFTQIPVYQKAVLIAMLDLYASCFEKDETQRQKVSERIADIDHDWLAGYFDESASNVFALIRDDLRKNYDCLLTIKNGQPSKKAAASLRESVEKLKIHLPETEEGMYYAMYAFQDTIWGFGDLITAPRTQAEEECGLIALEYIGALWPLLRDNIVNNNYVFSNLLFYLNSCAEKFGLHGLPEVHPQTIL